MRSWTAVILLLGVPIWGCSRGPITAINDALSSAAEEVSAKADYEKLPAIEVPPGDWPWWRGPGVDGKALEASIPTEWSTDVNVLWRADVPGEGHSSPVVWGDRIFLTTADMPQQLQQLLCFDRDTGNRLWSLTLHQGGFMNMHSKNSQASATAACDGERVFTAFINDGALWVSAVGFDGKLLWQNKAGDFRSEHGYGSSPTLYGSLVIVNGDNPGGGYLAALHRKTGEVIWRTARPKAGSYCTPIVATVAGKPQLLVSGHNMVASYNPEDGKQIWTCTGPANTTANTVGFDDLHVYASGGFPQKEIVCVRADGSGAVSSPHVRWRSSRGVSYEPSPLVHDGLVYFASSGVATCFDAATGEEVWKQRLGGEVTSSFVLAGDLLLIGNEKGMTTVLSAGRKTKILAKNNLDERIMATPAVTRDRLYLRTQSRLYCIGTANP
jgi:outer membrane protein assembly factor BamB